MTNLESLLAQRTQLDAQIAAEKSAAIEQIKALMTACNVTLDDLGAKPVAAAGKRPVKYRDDAGNTWTGVGQRPRWLVARLHAGADLESFRVKG